MKILVTGTGRGGTNLVTELIRGMNIVKFTPQVEDRTFFNSTIISNNYGTKLATDNKNFSIENIKKMMDNNSDLYVVFALRHPIDNALSKIVRGQPKSKGGDSTVEEIAPDGTIDGSIESLKHMFDIYNFLIEKYSKRIFVIKMEELILYPKEMTKKACDYFDVEYNENILNFAKNNRNKYQKNRYGNDLVKNVDLYLDLKNNFGGYFSDNQIIINKLKENLNDIIIKLNYE